MTLSINIIVPVYRGITETKNCLNSLLNSSQQIAYTIIVIDDCSPEPELVTYLDNLSQSGAIELLRNHENIGFIATVNLGMKQHPQCDVVLLNNDTVVANNWLDRLYQCAYSRERIASVSPFSNNATICSYPQFCRDNALPIGITVAQLDTCFAIVNAGKSVELPTTVGFCMYIRRAALNEIGLFDAVTFGKGYGEENDFCMRAQSAGWQHLLCADTFVYHTGNVSFGESHNPRKLAAMKILRERYPTYDSLIIEHINADPARDLRLRATLASLYLRHCPLILIINHNRHGGTLRHIHELIHKLEPQAQFLLLTPTLDGSGAVELRYAEHFNLYFQIEQDFYKLVELLRAIKLDRIHVHHTLGLPPVVLGLPVQLGITWDFTVHDYYSVCPQINLVHSDGSYCGEPDIAGCNTCLRLRPAPGRVSIQTWREHSLRLLSTAERCFTPSRDCTHRMQRYFPQIHWHTAYHEPQDTIFPLPQTHILEEREDMRIVVIGALSAMKGADVLEDAARDAKLRNLSLTFNLLGYGYRNLSQMPDTKLQVHGSYKEQDLLKLLHQAAPHLIWFPALWPETYSYTLSAALHYGAPIVAPNLGAFTERLAGRAYTWLVPWDWTPQQFNHFFLQIKNYSLQNTALDVYAATQESTADTAADFDYQRDYLPPSCQSDFLPSLDQEVITAFVERYLVPRPPLSIASRLRGIVLKILVHLRATTWLRPVMRKIPTAWQTWVKNILLRN